MPTLGQKVGLWANLARSFTQKWINMSLSLQNLSNLDSLKKKQFNYMEFEQPII